MKTNTVVVVLIAGAVLTTLAGCNSTAGSAENPLPSPSASAVSLPSVVISPEELVACSSEPTKSRIEAALVNSTISMETSPLALPQDMGTLAQAESQLDAWNALSEADRLYNLCFNYQQGGF